MLKLPIQIATQEVADLANPAIEHLSYHLKWWGLTLFDIAEIDTFNQLFDSEALIPAEDSPDLPLRLRCVLGYKPFLVQLITLCESIEFEPDNEIILISNLSKAFLIASISRSAQHV